ncbi:MAG: hypothetical protein AB8H80_06455 [Planctomycetota bacterium]
MPLKTIARKLVQLTTAGLALINSTVAQELVRDFTPGHSLSPASSFAKPLAPLPNGDALFELQRPTTGCELWRTDGTAAGTSLVADINPGVASSDVEQFRALPSGIHLFVATTALNGQELWRTDGTPQGTQLVADVFPGPLSSGIRLLNAIGSDFVFVANDDVAGAELWRTDGTASGTSKFADIHAGISLLSAPTQLAAIGPSTGVFTYRDNGLWQLWRTDLTSAGTSKIIDLPTGTVTAPLGMTQIGNLALFVAFDELWVTDGTAAGTQALAPSRSVEPYVSGNSAYFFHQDDEIWRTDGTAIGTQFVADVALSSFNQPQWLGTTGNNVTLFSSNAPTPSIVRTDGTASGTYRLVPEGLFPGNLNEGRAAVRIANGDILFRGRNFALGQRLWKSDGTIDGTVPLPTPPLGGLVPFQNGAIFAGFGFGQGQELWFSDGTLPRTEALIDLARDRSPLSSNLELLGSFRDQAVVQNRRVSGDSLWLSDGTPGGTRSIASFPGVGIQANVVSTGETFFVLFNQSGVLANAIWKYDETTDSLQPLAIESNYPSFSLFGGSAVAIHESIVFFARTPTTGGEPWTSDGTVGGTLPLADIAPGALSSTIGELYSWRGKAYFLGWSQTNGSEPWVTDGTPAGTYQLIETAPGSQGSNFLQWQASGDLLYLVSPTLNSVWVTDEAATGVTLIPTNGLSFTFGGSPTPIRTPTGDQLAYASFNFPGGVLLFDGQAMTAQQLQLPFTPTTILPLSRDRIALLSSVSTSNNVWVSDGTAAGTQLVDDWAQSPFLQQTKPRMISDSRLGLVLNDPMLGIELHSFDGTGPAEVLADLSSGSSRPSSWMRAGNKIFITAYNDIYGRELLAIDTSLLQDSIVASIGYGCAGSGAAPPRLSTTNGASASTGTIDLELVGAQPNALAIIGLAAEDAAIAAGTGTGPTASNCPIWLGGSPVAVAVTCDAAGRATLPLPVTPALFGMRFFAQGFAVDPSGPLLGFLSTTAGLEVLIGP